jgi:pSer/pThr/pTyr-binding forkhead associated (FHA) protein
MTASPSIPYRLLLDDGTVRSVTGYCLLGRRPTTEGLTDEIDGSSDVEVVEVEDPTRSLSRTHCALGQFEDLLWVTDLGSNNGTMLVYPNGSTHRLEPRVRYELDPGCVIRAGTHTITVLW